MSCFKQILFRMAVIAALSAVLALACGPFFGIEVLGNRKEVLLASPTISFESELKTLVPLPKDKLPVVEAENAYEPVVSRESVETRDLQPDVFTRVQVMRRQDNGDAARASGAGLPPAIQLYTAGAVSFLHGQKDSARTYFEKVLTLENEQRKSRELWARFMLGRMALQSGDQANAVTQFEAVRALVRQGLPDPLGLAVSSLGEQALGAWKDRNVAEAVNLYAQQAAYGSPSGADSLVTIAGLILKNKDLLDQAIQDTVSRRLLLICVNGNNGRPFFIDVGPDGGADSTVDRIVAALERHHLNNIAGAGLLAAAAYHQARFDLAQKLSVLEDTPMSAWVVAKLALRQGNRDAALQAYERALKGFPVADATAIQAETGVLRVSREDYKQALNLFYHAVASGIRPVSGRYTDDDWFGFADYWGDAAYLAERVLTIKELQDYVDHQLPASSTLGEQWERSRIRSILARRLMRAEQFRQALPYFDDNKTRHLAEQYGDAVNKAGSWWRWKLTRAEAWFAAAKLARNNGMEILGFEREPDYAMWNGNFGDADVSAVTPANGKQADSFQTENERKRVWASRPEHDVRFQYRLTAVNQTRKAAELLPASSQAYAAVLCEGTRWTIDRQPEQAAQLYQLYLHHGAYVSWGRTFGRQCPAADFAAASSWNTVLRQQKHLTKKAILHPVYAGALAFGTMIVLSTLIYYGRAWKKREQTS